jgi:protein phosphatase
MPAPGAHGAETLPNLAAAETPISTPFRDLFGRTHAGHLRPDNQDHYLMLDVERAMTVRGSSLGPTHFRTVSTGTLLVVADGIGGHSNGELASAVAIDTIAEYAAGALPVDPGNIDESARSHNGFQEAARECQRRIRGAARRRGAALDLGTTLTALYAQAGVAEVAHVGDSRAYLVRPGVGCWRLTHDHTLGAQLEHSTGEPAQGVAHILTNAIGAIDDDPRVEALHVPMMPGDRFLVCSDGLTNFVDDAAIDALLVAATSARDAVDRLFERALATEASDNITVVVAIV